MSIYQALTLTPNLLSLPTGTPVGSYPAHTLYTCTNARPHTHRELGDWMTIDRDAAVSFCGVELALEAQGDAGNGYAWVRIEIEMDAEQSRVGDRVEFVVE